MLGGETSLYRQALGLVSSTSNQNTLCSIFKRRKMLLILFVICAFRCCPHLTEVAGIAPAANAILKADVLAGLPGINTSSPNCKSFFLFSYSYSINSAIRSHFLQNQFYKTMGSSNFSLKCLRTIEVALCLIKSIFGIVSKSNRALRLRPQSQ